MNRIIRLRAWDTKTKKWLDSVPPEEYIKGTFWWDDELVSEMEGFGTIIGNIFENPELLELSKYE